MLLTKLSARDFTVWLSSFDHDDRFRIINWSHKGQLYHYSDVDQHSELLCYLSALCVHNVCLMGLSWGKKGGSERGGACAMCNVSELYNPAVFIMSHTRPTHVDRSRHLAARVMRSLLYHKLLERKDCHFVDWHLFNAKRRQYICGGPYVDSSVVYCTGVLSFYIVWLFRPSAWMHDFQFKSEVSRRWETMETVKYRFEVSMWKCGTEGSHNIHF